MPCRHTFCKDCLTNRPDKTCPRYDSANEAINVINKHTNMVWATVWIPLPSPSPTITTSCLSPPPPFFPSSAPPTLHTMFVSNKVCFFFCFFLFNIVL